MSSVSENPARGGPEETGGQKSAFPKTGLFLAVLIASYFGVALALSLIRFWGLYAGTWDLGLDMQTLWTGYHSGTFYNAPNYESYFATSFFVVHPSLILYPVAQLYGIVPTPATLFVLQAAVVSLAAVPLYVLIRDLGGSPSRGLLGAGLYLVWAPLLGANLYDWHLESFLPLELFSFFVLWRRGRYPWAVVPAVFAAITIEVGPILIGICAVFFGLPSFRGMGRACYDALRREPKWLVKTRTGLRNWWARPSTQPALWLLIGCILGYAALRGIEVYYAGLDPLSGQLSYSTKLLEPSGIGVSLSYLGLYKSSKLTYWVLTFALVGFLPFLAPRTLLLSAPWFVFTIFGDINPYTIIGYQYAFVLASTLFLGVAYGLVKIRNRTDSKLELAEAPKPPPWVRRMRGLQKAEFWGTILGIVVVANLVLSPANPLVQRNPNFGQGYRLSYEFGPGFQNVEKIAAMVGPTSTVIASTHLFPFVANNPNAYTFLNAPGILPGFPFTNGPLPQFVFVDQAESTAVPQWFAETVYSGNLYGLLAATGTWSGSATGPVFLFEYGYQGPQHLMDLPSLTPTFFYGSMLRLGPTAQVINTPNASFGQIIQAAPGVLNNSWYGPYVALLKGNYTVTISMRALLPPGAPAPPPSTAVFLILAYAWGLPNIYDRVLNYSILNSTSWPVIQFHVSVTSALLNFEVPGYSFGAGGGLYFQLNYIELAPVSG